MRNARIARFARFMYPSLARNFDQGFRMGDPTAPATSITLRNIDPDLKVRLRLRAAANDRSMESEAREIMRAALADPAPTARERPQGWGKRRMAVLTGLAGATEDEVVAVVTMRTGVVAEAISAIAAKVAEGEHVALHSIAADEIGDLLVRCGYNERALAAVRGTGQA